ncbi:ATP-dependent Clp protease ATP-binding subunit [Zobellia galactanivorans]|uniref:Chaperone ClpB n=1 Tax=Zobellia galactanivorans (strain DSM 12802 / CCUG 47099 / CIP 106680 / NCIMB 13871 / Dsij) TaxID=63186 RepID=G0L9C0_ZOBGA|nr:MULTISPECIES: ATP-dependent Clp protease ATP-binding subunit [Zobellia]MDO6811011.1 ATP-dependent Clp protease ATP-binding subunit [Zobellia galactanivorans]OWW24527.1 type VI secretion system ATPase ClpV [Zobellia sp. OII3]CAZ94478.1 Chaperone ClpB [Zobellia galactanivorans]
MNTELEKAIHIATQIADEYQHDSFGPAHLVKATLHRDLSLLRFLHNKNVDVYFIEEWAEVRLEEYPKRTSRSGDLKASPEAQLVFNEAEDIQQKLNKEEPDLICIFIAAITPGVGFTFDQLKSIPLSSNQLLDDLISQRKTDKSGTVNTKTAPGSTPPKSDGVLYKYAKDLLEPAREGSYDHIVNRDRELKKIIEILSRKNKPNVIIQGESGVGKSVLAQNLAREIVGGKIVENLKDAHLFEIDTALLLSGASYKGEVEDRLQNIFDEAKALVKPIVFIDDFHFLLQDASSSQGILNVIKSELNKGEVILVGATNSDNYRKYISNDDALNRRFESVTLEEPDNEMAFRILQSIGQTYTDHHELQLTEDTLREAIRLSKRYLKEKSLPDSALDLLDRTMAAANVSEQSLPNDLEELKARMEAIEEKAEERDEAENIQEIDWVYMALRNKLSPIVLGKFDTEDAFGFPSYNEKSTYLKNIISAIDAHSKTPREAVLEEDLAAMVSSITGIPAGKVQTKEKERLMDMEDTLKKRVIGQDNAIKTVTEAIIESRSGLSKAGQPIGSFFFSGPTGTGKTELAKSLAEFLFNDESAIIRFDMSEFKEEHSAALLYGAPPGYVGYEEGGVLVNKIRQKPYSIVLFDEIEKAHQSVFDVFLQILDEGKLSDRLGKVGDFSNAVILFTSNIGSEFISKAFEGGSVPKSDELLEIMASYFRPEFLGRITEIVPFAPISEKNAPTIFDLHLMKELLVLTERLGITLEIDKETKEHLSLDGFSPTYGVRPLKAVIRNKLKRPLSKMIISGEIKAPQTVKVEMKNKEVVFSVVE